MLGQPVLMVDVMGLVYGGGGGATGASITLRERSRYPALVKDAQAVTCKVMM